MSKTIHLSDTIEFFQISSSNFGFSNKKVLVKIIKKKIKFQISLQGNASLFIAIILEEIIK
jgi:hypothetical protein